MIEKEMQQDMSIDTSFACTDYDELTQKFGPKKSDSLLLSSLYYDMGFDSRGYRVGECGSFLEFSHDFDINTGVIADKGKLHNANFCRDLLCPMCNWRKSLKQISQLSAVLNSPNIKDKYKCLMMTLTIPNVKYEELSRGIDKCLKSFDRLMHRKKYKNIIKGFFRSLEVTVNEKTGTLHPHLHVLVLVPLSYGTRNIYISHDDLLNDWREVTNDFSITQVDIRKAYSKKTQDPDQSDMSSAAFEVAKYAAKVPKRYYRSDIIGALLFGLSHRRTYSYGGVMKDTYETLGIEDIEDADLVHINDIVPESVIQMIVRYGWSPSGYQIINTRLEGGNANEYYEVC